MLWKLMLDHLNLIDQKKVLMNHPWLVWLNSITLKLVVNWIFSLRTRFIWKLLNENCLLKKELEDIRESLNRSNNFVKILDDKVGGIDQWRSQKTISGGAIKVIGELSKLNFIFEAKIFNLSQKFSIWAKKSQFEPKIVIFEEK